MADITWSFAGKVALVSGGASGIGRAAAAAWVAAGARVAVFDQSAERLEETAAALGREAVASMAGAVSDAGDCERAVAATVARLGGVVALTQVAALELATHRVTVNAIAPGPVDTNLTAPLFAMPGAREEFLRHVPLGRMGRAEDIAQAILFLSSEAAEWVTGQCFYVDGGQSMVALPPYIDLVERLLGAKL